MTAFLGTLVLTASSLGISVVLARAALTGALLAAGLHASSRPERPSPDRPA
jgi:hypothetical protein